MKGLAGVFGENLANVYDFVYQARGQDFEAEARAVAGIVFERYPRATSLLDFGCGTGEHLRWLRKWFVHVEGVDASEAMVAEARRKLPQDTIHLSDVCCIDLDRSFDAVIALSTVIAYMPSLEAACEMIQRMVKHLAPDGVIVIEPWYFPEQFIDGYIAGDVVRDERRTVARVSHTHREDDTAHIHSHYLVADHDGIEHFSEVHMFGLWTRAQYVDAFTEAGCTVQYIEGVQSGRGVFVGRRQW